MADSAPMENFLSALMKRKGAPKANGRPKKGMTLADLAPLPRGVQTRNPTRAKPPPLAPVPTLAGKL